MESGAIFLLQNDKTLVEMHEQRYDSEDLLQRLLADYPSLLAGELMNRASPRRWLLIKREAGVPSAFASSDRWSIDHLFLDQDGIPTIVEVKRSSDTRIRREVVGQMLDYAANAVAYWPMARIRQMFDESCRMNALDADARVLALLQSDLELDAGAVDRFWQSVEQNLDTKRLRLVFVADSIPEELQRIIEFLNEQMTQVEVLAVEIRQYVGQGSQTLVPRVFGKTAEAQIRKRQAPPPTIDEASLLAQMPREYSQAVKAMLDLVRENGLTIYWGTVGCSIQTQARDRRAPLSIGWVNPPDRSGWNGLMDVTLGVDRGSAELISPHLLDKVDWYEEQIALLPGARPTKGLAAYSFEPQNFIAQREEISSLLLAFAQSLKRE